MAGVFQAKLRKIYTKQESPTPMVLQDLGVMGKMEGVEFFDSVAEVMSHSL